MKVSFTHAFFISLSEQKSGMHGYRDSWYMKPYYTISKSYSIDKIKIHSVLEKKKIWKWKMSFLCCDLKENFSLL